MSRIDQMDRHIQIYEYYEFYNMCRGILLNVAANFESFQCISSRCVLPLLWDINQGIGPVVDAFGGYAYLDTINHKINIYVAKRVPATKCKSPFHSQTTATRIKCIQMHALEPSGESHRFHRTFQSKTPIDTSATARNLYIPRFSGRHLGRRPCLCHLCLLLAVRGCFHAKRHLKQPSSFIHFIRWKKLLCQ